MVKNAGCYNKMFAGGWWKTWFQQIASLMCMMSSQVSKLWLCRYGVGVLCAHLSLWDFAIGYAIHVSQGKILHHACHCNCVLIFIGMLLSHCHAVVYMVNTLDAIHKRRSLQYVNWPIGYYASIIMSIIYILCRWQKALSIIL